MTKDKEKAIKASERQELVKKAISKNENFHLAIQDRKEIKQFLEKVLQKLPENEKNIIKQRCTNHLCFSRNEEILNQEFRAKLKAGGDEKILIEELFLKIDKLQESCMLVETRCQLLHGNYWKEAEITRFDEIKFLKEV